MNLKKLNKVLNDSTIHSNFKVFIFLNYSQIPLFVIIKISSKSIWGD